MTTGLQMGGMHGPVKTVAQALALLDGAQAAAPPGSVNDDGTVNWDKTQPFEVTLPKKGADPATVSTWWNGLSPQEQNYLLRKHPAPLGNMDGIPCAERDQANRQRLTSYLDAMREQQKTADELGLPADEVFARSGHGASYQDLIKLQKALGSSSGDGNTYLLGFKPTEGQGHAITSYGNPDTATSVSTLVGGMTTGPGDLPDHMGYSERLAILANSHPGTSAAGVTWWGYDAPPGLSAASDDGRAVAGAPSLDSFQSGLRTTHEGVTRSRNTVIGHSYGTLLVGESASHGRTLDADNVVFLGSPGVGVDHASDLRLTGIAPEDTADHVYTSRADHDVIKYASGTKS